MPALPNADEPHKMPHGYWKIIVFPCKSISSLEVAAFIFDQDTPRNDKVIDHINTIDTIEKRNGLDFLRELPDDIMFFFVFLDLVLSPKMENSLLRVLSIALDATYLIASILPLITKSRKTACLTYSEMPKRLFQQRSLISFFSCSVTLKVITQFLLSSAPSLTHSSKNLL